MDLLKWPYVSFLQKYNTQSVKENDKLILHTIAWVYQFISSCYFIVYFTTSYIILHSDNSSIGIVFSFFIVCPVGSELQQYFFIQILTFL